VSEKRSELTTQQRTLNAAGAEVVLSQAERAAVEAGCSMSIAVVDNAGYLLAFRRMDGALRLTVSIALKKAQSASLLNSRTSGFQRMLDGGMPSLLSITDVWPLQGGVPVVEDGVQVGAIGSSGGTGDEDELVSEAGAAALRTETASDLPPAAPAMTTD
jgi:glc operon protein GlcG